MKAVMYNKKGTPNKLIYCDTVKPIPSDNEVLIKILSASPNAADYRSMKMGIIPKRKIFGSAISGTVESVGKNIQKFKFGDNVIGDLSDFGFGGFAEFTVAPEKALIQKPVKLTFEQAATLPVAATTALKAMLKGNIQKEKRVLLIGCSGGVGTFAVQLAKYFGSEVTAVCSTKNLQQSASLGADNVIDYTKMDFTKDSKYYDLIIAINGSYSLLSCKRVLNRNGIYVIVGGALSQIFKALMFGRLLSFGSKTILTLSAKANPKDLEIVANLVEEGKLKPIIENRYKLSETSDAMRYLAEGHVKGKLVINVN